MRDRIAELGIADQVQFDGFVSPLPEWLANIDLLVVPSTCDDASPLVMLEAMSVGTPAVGTRMGGIPEILRDDLESCLVAGLTPQSLAEVIQDALQADLQQLGEKGRQQILRDHTIEEQMRLLEKSLKSYEN